MKSIRYCYPIFFAVLIVLLFVSPAIAEMEVYAVFENPTYTPSSTEAVPINTNACQIFSGNVGPTHAVKWNLITQPIPLNTPNSAPVGIPPGKNTKFLLQSSIGSPFDCTQTWVSLDGYVDGIRVDVQNGNDANDGFTWATAFKTIQAAINKAYNYGIQDVYVSQGTFHENITIPAGVMLSGGHTPGGRNFNLYPSIINGNGQTHTVEIQNGYRQGIDGFTITGGNAVTGGGIYCSGVRNSPTIQNCIIRNNASINGGGIYAGNSNPEIINCLIYDNTATERGGGIYAAGHFTLTNCTITSNTATIENAGSGVYIQTSYVPAATIINSIIWGNSESSLVYMGSSPYISYTCMGDEYAGEGNITQDPKFSDPVNKNFRLSSSSPCINAGSDKAMSEYDLNYTLRPFDYHTDIGAYEYSGVYADSDNDQLFDYWEYYWFGDVTFYTYQDDPDSDGFSNSDEYDNFKDPTDSNSFPETNVFYVSPTGTDPSDLVTCDQMLGTWKSPFKTIQAAINWAVNQINCKGLSEATVSVREGIYTGNGNRDLNLQGKPIVLRAEQGPEKTIIDCEFETVGITFNHGETAATVLHGFTIQNAKGDVVDPASHTILKANVGAVFVDHSSPTINNCILSNNRADKGAGISCWNNAAPTINGCTIRGNQADSEGGGIYLSFSSPRISMCDVVENIAQSGGGIICTENSSPKIAGCNIRDNQADYGAGILFDMGASPEVTNCLITGNRADTIGGGLLSQNYATPIITNCTIVDNEAGNYGAGLGCYGYESLPVLTNSILWDNLPDEVDCETAVISYSDVKGSGGSVSGWTLPSGTDGGGNIDQNPNFRNSGDDPFRLLPGSPCIDTGANIGDLYSDKRGSIRPMDVDGTKGNDALHNNFDMGAYEYSAYPNGSEDETIKAFKNIFTDISYITIKNSYDIHWSNRTPFPNNDNRITGSSGEYTYHVRRLLVSEYGKTIELDEVNGVSSMEPLEDGYYSYPFIFCPKHLGIWYLRLEMADDPEQFELSETPVIINPDDIKHWTIGQIIEPPKGADLKQEPVIDEDVKDAFYWYNGKLYALSPIPVIDGAEDPCQEGAATSGITSIGWFGENGGYIYVQGTNIWPETLQIHIAGTPPVELMPAQSKYRNVELKYSENDATIEGLNHFVATEPGKSVLLYWQGEIQNSDLKFHIVETKIWEDEVVPENWYIGKEIISPYHNSEFGKNGYVFNTLSTFAVNTQTEEPFDGYDIETQKGPIVPVNKDDADHDDLLVIWYQKNSDTNAFWPYKPVLYTPVWPPCQEPEACNQITIANEDGTAKHFTGMESITVYNQPDPEQSGFNPNEEHAMVIGDVVFALRDDLNDDLGKSEPYTIVKYQDPADDDKWKFKAFQVIKGNLTYTGNAGTLVQPPYPLSILPVCMQSYGNSSIIWWEDYKGNLWAKRNGTGTLYFYYPLQEGFYYDLNDDGEPDAEPGDCLPWLDNRTGTPAAVTYNISWPNSPELQIGETLIEPKNGLPDIRNQCDVQIIFDQSKDDKGMGRSVKLMEVLSEWEVDYPFTNGAEVLSELPSEIKRLEVGSNTVIFPDLPPALKYRVSYDYLNHTLKFKGIYDDSMVGEPLLLLNIMTEREKTAIKYLASESEGWNLDCTNAFGKAKNFVCAVDGLYTKSREKISGEDQITGTHLFKVLTAAGQSGECGYVTLAFNNNKEFCEGNPVALEVIYVKETLYPGELKLIEPDNPFDERMTFRHSSDFAAEQDDFTFEWRYCPDIDEPDLPVTKPDGTTDYGGRWIALGVTENNEDVILNGLDDNSKAFNDVTIGGSGIQTLQDKWIICRYKGYIRCGLTADKWSEWTKPMLYENWVKRVIRKINPFEQRFKNFHDTGVATFVNMLEQAGKKYEGDVALNYDPDYINKIGLIELYETVLKRSKELSIDGTPAEDDENANNAILMAASRVADLYTLLGNEAYADAADPTIGFPTESGPITKASSIFCFQNMLANLLQEELELLRGRDSSRNPDIDIRPVYNRLIWNFTTGDGELAYKMNYAVDTLDEAKKRYPQGHGDAWGHYLTAIKRYYDLLLHEKYTWIPRTESVIVAGTPVDVDYLDERNFAEIAAAKARTGAEIVNLTYRERYVENPSGQWQGYKDSETERAWGLSEWAIRAGQGAYLDWVTANAILPEKVAYKISDTTFNKLKTEAIPESTLEQLEVLKNRSYQSENDLLNDLTETIGEDQTEQYQEIILKYSNLTNNPEQKIDRTTVPELFEIASRLTEIQTELDTADIGLNPLGLAKDAIPFDISPASVDEGNTHFEQIYERAVRQMNNAIVVFDFANQNTQRLRQQEDTIENFVNNVEDREADFNNRLIEIFGYPYSDDIGLGKTYPPGYDGPDLYHFSYVDISNLMGVQPGETYEFTIKFVDSFDISLTGKAAPKRIEIPYEISTEGWGFIKPSKWIGTRKAPGELQMARSEILLAKTRFEKVLDEYDNLILQIEDEAKMLEAQYNLNANHINILNRVQNKQISLNESIIMSRQLQSLYRKIAYIASLKGKALSEALPKVTGAIVGMATGIFIDPWSTLRSAIELVSTNLAEIMTAMADFESYNEMKLQQDKEIVQSQSNIDITTLQNNFAIDQKLTQIEQMIRNEASIRLELYMLQENIQQASGRYLSALAKGERLLQDRTRFRVQTADDIREYRFKDMAFRIFRNDALQKYRAQFDLAARFVYLAAKAYDYDTGLLDAHQLAGERFFTHIVKQRTIGEINGGIPMTGSGLAEPMAQMYQNFMVLKPQMGFNNPQLEQNEFSLRSELFRIANSTTSEQNWKLALETHRVADLWDMSEFRRYCMPFDTEANSSPAPAIVIPFDTYITSGLNYFGKDLGGHDSYFDSSRFVTKIRGVGVVFSEYDNANLAETPRIYLVPVGEDFIRAPYNDDFNLRTFKIIDQLLPVPFAIHTADIQNNRYWIPIVDTLPEAIFNIRRHSRFRAYHDNGAGWDDKIVFDTRLIGRSVWNTKWLLIIPGESLYSDAEEGVDRFIHGTLTTDGVRNGIGVTDIKMMFNTYSYEGNK